MSTIITSNVSDGTLSIPTTYVTNGSAKAWVNFNGTGTIAARDSLNVSSLTDNGTGDYRVNFSNVFGAADYAAVLTSENVSILRTASIPTTSSIGVGGQNSNGTLVDATYVQFAAHGDLA